MSDIERVCFGVVPASLLEHLNCGDWKVRSSAIVEVNLNCICFPKSRKLQNEISQLNNAEVIIPHLSGLMSFLSKLLQDTNFKITLTTLQIIDTILTKTKREIQPSLPHFVPGLVEVSS